jgi:hypothetical protein
LFQRREYEIVTPEKTVSELQVGERREVVVARDDGFDVPTCGEAICVELDFNDSCGVFLDELEGGT